MKVNYQRDISFKSIYTNRAVKKGLEFAADYGALFAAGAAAGFSVARPLAIWMTPKTDKENRLLAVSKSLSSSAIGLLITTCLALPLGAAIKKISKNPYKYLKQESIKEFEKCSGNIEKSKSYEFATQLGKLGLGSVVAVPKSIAVASSVPYIASKISDNKLDDRHAKSQKLNSFNNILLKDERPSVNNLSFKASPNEKLAKQIGKLLDKKWLQKFADKNKDTNFPMHIAALTDAVATATFICQTKKSTKIEEARKKPLMYNAGIATILSIAGGYVIDKILDGPTKNFIKKYKQINKGDSNLAKQVQGIKIAKPILILGTIYYMLIPFISTFLAEKANAKSNYDNPEELKKEL